MSFWNRSKEGSSRGALPTSIRTSRGWTETLAFLKEREGLRVLDFGDTAPSNINFLTALGHSVYMANVVEDASKPEWQSTGEDGKPFFDAARFAETHLSFSGKEFDAVLLWDTADYLPPAAAPLLFERLRHQLHPAGRLLAFMHGKSEGPGTQYNRFHISDSPDLVLHPVGNFPIRNIVQMRQMETYLEGYSDRRFLLGKDNVREVIAVR